MQATLVSPSPSSFAFKLMRDLPQTLGAPHDAGKVAILRPCQETGGGVLRLLHTHPFYLGQSSYRNLKYQLLITELANVARGFLTCQRLVNSDIVGV